MSQTNPERLRERLRALIEIWREERDRLWPFNRSPDNTAGEAERYARALTWDSAAKDLEVVLAEGADQDAYRAGLAAASVDLWQPIATAPKDGTRVLLYWRAEMDGEVLFWAVGAWRQGGWSGSSFAASRPKCWTTLIGEHPTHWRPLDAPR